MPEEVNVHQAKTHLSRLLARIQEGEEFIIAKNGKPIARLLPAIEAKNKRVPGSAQGKLQIAADFNAPLPDDMLEDFEQ